MEIPAMAVTEEQLDSFHRFAAEKLADDASDLSLQELLDLWRIANPTPEELQENLRAVKAAIRDRENGDRGIPFEDHIQEMQGKHSIPADE